MVSLTRQCVDVILALAIAKIATRRLDYPRTPGRTAKYGKGQRAKPSENGGTGRGLTTILLWRHLASSEDLLAKTFKC